MNPRPRMAQIGSASPVVRADHQKVGVLYLYAEPDAALLFCENETNMARIFGAEPTTRFPKDDIGEILSLREPLAGTTVQTLPGTPGHLPAWFPQIKYMNRRYELDVILT
jgi:hypothetical protein